MNDEEYFYHIIKILENGEEDEISFYNGALVLRTKLNDITPRLIDADKIIIRNAGYFGEYQTEDYFLREAKTHWTHFLNEVADGTYPLEKLPEHVRELAKELYYK